MKPETRYTKSGRINIAFQSFGNGPVDIVYIPRWVSNIDWMWSCPELVAFLKELGQIGRVILFDKRGTGLSDRVVELSTLEERMDDIRAVMDAVNSEKAVLFGHSEGGSVSALFAATYPNRVISLITFGAFAKRRYSEDYPWAPTNEERSKVYDLIENNWGGGNMNLSTLAPSKANDKTFMDWLANYFRSGASPSAALVLTKMNTEVDIIGILHSIKVPTLLLQRVNDIDVKIEEGRFIASRIPGAKLIEFEGDDHLFWAGNMEEVLLEIKSFIAQNERKHNYDRQLLTIALFSISKNENKIPVKSDEFSTHNNRLIMSIVGQYRGKIISNTADHCLAIFEGPSKAAHCAIDVLSSLTTGAAHVSTCIHIGECMVADKGENISGEAIDIVFQIAKALQGYPILITETVKNLLSGAGLICTPLQNPKSKTNASVISLYTIQDHIVDKIIPNRLEQDITSPKNDSFLENILQSIENNIDNEFYGVDNLCREVGISERQLQRKLKLIANKTPNQMIRSVRLHRAKELLLQDRKNISEAAFQTGFSNLSYFSKCFKEEFGKLPSTITS